MAEGEGLCVHLPEEANRLRMSLYSFPLEGTTGTRVYRVTGLTKPFFHAFRGKHAADPLCYALDWDSDAV